MRRPAGGRANVEDSVVGESREIEERPEKPGVEQWPRPVRQEVEEIVRRLCRRLVAEATARLAEAEDGGSAPDGLQDGPPDEDADRGFSPGGLQNSPPDEDADRGFSPDGLQNGPPDKVADHGFPPDGLQSGSSDKDADRGFSPDDLQKETPRAGNQGETENHRKMGRRQAARDARRLARVRAAILAERDLFVDQGWVATRRDRDAQGRPRNYRELRYRADGRQRRIYLGPSERLAEEVRRLLDEIRRPKREEQFLRKAKREAKAAVRRDRKNPWVQAGLAIGEGLDRTDKQHPATEEELARMFPGPAPTVAGRS